MTIPSEDIGILLEAQGVGTINAVSGWGIFYSIEPTSPETTITIFDTVGRASNPKFLLDHPSIQIRVRGPKQDYRLGYEKAQQIKDELLGIPSQVINGMEYIGIWMRSDIHHLDYDDEKRPRFVATYAITREPIEGSPQTHRQPL